MFIVGHSSRTCQTKGLIITVKSIKALPKQKPIVIFHRYSKDQTTKPDLLRLDLLGWWTSRSVWSQHPSIRWALFIKLINIL